MTPDSTRTPPAAAGDKKAGSKEGTKPRAGVPVWRIGKPDAFLAAAVDAARAAIEGIAPAEQVGRHLAAKSEGDRLVTHLFESKLAGYGGWQWYAVLTRNSRSKVVTVDELGLLPSADSILPPEWIPWAERVRPGDEQAADEAGSPARAATREDTGSSDAAVVPGGFEDAPEAGTGDPDGDDPDGDDSDDAAGDGPDEHPEAEAH